jgi:DNA modification methylase
MFNPAGVSNGKWGYILAHIILYYGKNPKHAKAGNGGSSFIEKNENVNDIKKIHPCPKPLRFIKWAVCKASFENEIIFDPFMGSGTTGVACVETNRRFIGIEINEKYFYAACERIATAAAQGKLGFEHDNKKEDNHKNSLFDL